MMGVMGVEAESCRCDWRGAQGSNVRFTARTVCSVRSTAQSATSLCQPQDRAHKHNAKPSTDPAASQQQANCTTKSRDN